MFMQLHIFSLIGAQAYTAGMFDPGVGPHLFSSVACTGTEFRILECANTELMTVYCGHTHDAGVICQAGIYVYLCTLVSTCGNSTACCLVTKAGSLLLPPPLFSKPVAPPPSPTHPWRKLIQHAQNTKHLD